MQKKFDNFIRSRLEILGQLGNLSNGISPLEIYDQAGDFASRFIHPLDNELDQRTHAFPHHAWQDIADNGFKGIIIPTDYGGMGLAYMHLAMATLQISRASGSIGLSYLADQALCAHQIWKHGTPVQQAAYLPKLASGAFIGALAMSEPNAGTDVMNMSTLAIPASEMGEPGYIINGGKMWITNGGRVNEAGQNVTADILVLYAATQKNPKKLTAFLVEGGTPGFTAVHKIDKEGMRGSETWELRFDNCFVPTTHVLGEVDKGAHVLMQGLNAERLILGAGALGLAVAAMDDALSYTSERKTGGIPAAYRQAVADKLANLFSRLTTTNDHLLLTAAGAEKDLDNTAAASVFLQASRIATEITGENIYLHGGNGQTTDYRAGRLARDASLYRVGGGTEAVREQRIAEGIIDGYGEHLRRMQRLYRSLG